MAGISERINNIASSNSSTWGTKEEEKAARARIHDSQKGRAAWIKQQQDEENVKDQEFVKADKVAAQKRKRQHEDEITAMIAEAEATKASGDLGLKPSFFVEKAKQEVKPKLPGFIAVKKQKGNSQCQRGTPTKGEVLTPVELVTGDGAPRNDTNTQFAHGPIGLAGYGSSSSEEEDDS